MPDTNEKSKRIEELLKDIEDVLDQGKKGLFSDDMVKVSITDISDIINDIRENFPMQIIKSEQICSQQVKIINDAENEANRIAATATANAESLINKAKIEAARLVSNHEITIAAENERDRILNEAKTKYSETVAQAKKEANRIADEAKYNCEKMMTEATNYISKLLNSTLAVVNESFSFATASVENLKKQKNDITAVLNSFNNRNSNGR